MPESKNKKTKKKQQVVQPSPEKKRISRGQKRYMLASDVKEAAESYEAQAQEEAKNRAMLSALEFAGQEQQRQAQLGTGMLASGYVPQAQLLSGLQPGITGAEQRRQAMAQQAGAYGETYATGLEALLQSALAQANIAGGFGTSLATASLGGLFS